MLAITLFYSFPLYGGKGRTGVCNPSTFAGLLCDVLARAPRRIRTDSLLITKQLRFRCAREAYKIGAEGIEPSPAVCKTAVLPLDEAPL